MTNRDPVENPSRPAGLIRQCNYKMTGQLLSVSVLEG